MNDKALHCEICRRRVYKDYDSDWYFCPTCFALIEAFIREQKDKCIAVAQAKVANRRKKR